MKIGFLLFLFLVTPSMFAADLAVIETIPLEHAQGLEISPDGSELYVQYNDGSTKIAVVDTFTNTVLANIPFNGGYLMDISPDGTRLYLAGSAQLEIVDLVSRIALPPVLIPGATTAQSGVAVSPDGAKVYVSEYGRGTGYVHVIDAATLTYEKSIVADPYGWPFVMGIDVSPHGDFAYVSSRKYGHLDVIDLDSEVLLETVSQSFGTSSILTEVRMHPDGKQAYVTNVQYSFISVVDTNPASPTFHQEIDWFDTGASGLGRVTFSQDGLAGYVSDGPWGADRIYVFDSDPNSPGYHTVTEEVHVGTRPWDVLPFEQGDQVAYVAVWDPATEGGGYLAIVGHQEDATLTLVKNVVNDDGGSATVGDFQAFIDGNPVSWGEPQILSAGSYTVSESQHADYTASGWSNDCASDGMVTLNPGDDLVCEITNNDIATSIAYSCVGFAPPANFGPIKVKKNRAVPFKADMVDPASDPVTDLDIAAAPVIQVLFTAQGEGTPIDVTDDALPAGASSEGNIFTFTNSQWHYNLKTSNYTAPGSYEVTMVTGDNTEYVVEPTCEVSFVID